jgi:hypothetical protein
MSFIRAGLLVLAATTLGACGQQAGSPQPSASAPGSPSPSGKVIVYTSDWGSGERAAHGTVDVSKPSQLAKLKGAPTDFIDFVGRELTNGVDPQGECGTTVSVDGIDPATGVALGGVNGCGGADVLWIRRNGHWMEAAGSQMGGWECAVLEKFRVPKAIAPPTCLVYTGKEVQTLHYGGPGELPKPGTHGRRVVYMTTLNPDSSGADGVTINTEDDLAKLKGAPSRFVESVKDQQSDNPCTTMVYAIDPKVGIATGSASDCDDPHQVIWLLWHNSWIEVARSTGIWPCDDLKQWRIPDDFTGSTCIDWDDAGEQIVGYDGPKA